MIMSEEEFRMKMESGVIVKYGCISFHKQAGTYWYSYPPRYYTENTTHAFQSFDNFWREVSHWILYGIDYNNPNRKGPPALAFNPVINSCANRKTPGIILGDADEARATNVH